MCMLRFPCKLYAEEENHYNYIYKCLFCREYFEVLVIVFSSFGTAIKIEYMYKCMHFPRCIIHVPRAHEVKNQRVIDKRTSQIMKYG